MDKNSVKMLFSPFRSQHLPGGKHQNLPLHYFDLIGNLFEKPTPPQAMATWGWVAYTAVEVLVAVACCLGNALVLSAVCVGAWDSLREPTFCFLVSLAVADFLVGVAAVPMAVLLDGWVSVTPHLCLFLSCIVLVLTEASVLSLLAIAVDRYLRLHIPLR